MTAAPRRRLPRAERARRAAEVAHDGVAHRTELRAVGVSRADVRSEVEAGRWLVDGLQTVVIGNVRPTTGPAVHWRAVWETGSGAALDGPAALTAAGLTGVRLPEDRCLGAQEQPEPACRRGASPPPHRHAPDACGRAVEGRCAPRSGELRRVGRQ